MKTTFFLLALYGVFGFFACKREEANLSATGAQTIQDQDIHKSIRDHAPHSPKASGEIIASSILFRK